MEDAGRTGEDEHEAADGVEEDGDEDGVLAQAHPLDAANEVVVFLSRVRDGDLVEDEHTREADEGGILKLFKVVRQ